MILAINFDMLNVRRKKKSKIMSNSANQLPMPQ